MLYVLLVASNLAFLICGFYFGTKCSGTERYTIPFFSRDEEATVPSEQEQEGEE